MHDAITQTTAVLVHDAITQTEDATTLFPRHTKDEASTKTQDWLGSGLIDE